MKKEFTRVVTHRTSTHALSGHVRTIAVTTVYYEDGSSDVASQVEVNPATDPAILAALKTSLIELIEIERENHIAAGAPTPLGIVDSDDVSIRNILGRSVMATAALGNETPFNKTFRLKNNAEITVTADQMLAIGVAAGEFVDAIYERSWTLKAQVRAAKTVEDARAILISEGWPSA